MKIHRWSPWLRRHHTWAPLALWHADLAFNLIQILAMFAAASGFLWLVSQVS